eukprot:m.758778 g.758778  ORF g.758778 m.758778 type:complete len:83 (+) comp59037_c1_seq8:238-486(+)
MMMKTTTRDLTEDYDDYDYYCDYYCDDDDPRSHQWLLFVYGSTEQEVLLQQQSRGAEPLLAEQVEPAEGLKKHWSLVNPEGT